MSSPDEHLDHMLTKALAYQQNFYELLPDWTVYKTNDIKYLKQNIGYAIFGSPIFEKTSTSNDILNFNTCNKTDGKEITDVVCYGLNGQLIINAIAEQIIKHGLIPDDDIIKCGIIYLILFENNSSVECDEQNKMEHIALPLFKIMNNNDYTIWYVDIKGRVYKGWDDFLMTNNLPKCIIMYPKDGYYQPDPTFDIKPNHSFVWAIAKDSYACCQRAYRYSIFKTTMNFVGTTASIGLGIASFLTPVGSMIAVGGAIACGVWTTVECSMDLYDRSIHEESISPFNRSALSSWLGIAGCTVGLAVIGGEYLISRAATSGTTVSTFAKEAYNIALIGSISINLIGLGYQGISIFEKYQETGTFDMQDILYFGTHLLFFMNSVVNIKFANDIIEMTQGKVLKEYEENLRNDNMRKYYNHIKDETGATTTNKIEQNAAIIREINKFNTSNELGMQPICNSLTSTSNIPAVQQYQLKWNNITLIDPVAFLMDFATSYFCKLVTKTSEGPSTSNFKCQRNKLEKIFETLLGDFYTSRNCPKDVQVYEVSNFRKIINELAKVKHAEDILPAIFNLSLIFAKESNGYVYLVEGCCFIWEYIKRNMLEKGLAISSKFYNDTCNTYIKHLRIIVESLFDAVDKLISRFLNALQKYVNLTKHQLIHKSTAS